MTTHVWLLVIYVIVVLIGRAIAQTQRRPKRSLLSHRRAIITDWTVFPIALAAAVATALPVLEATLRETVVWNVYAAFGGLAVIAAGWGVAYAANRVIGENWSPTIDKTEEQNLVTSDVYSVVRHPLYLSGLLVLIGTNIYFASTWAWAGTALVLIAMLIRVPVEERRLVERFGEEYRAYRKRTKAILPWIL